VQTAAAHPPIGKLLIQILSCVMLLVKCGGVPCSAGSTSVTVMAEERSVRGPAVQFAEMQRK
jgi:hypothetical protein